LQEKELRNLAGARKHPAVFPSRLLALLFPGYLSPVSMRPDDALRKSFGLSCAGLSQQLEQF
jgi:hypothetical protein